MRKQKFCTFLYVLGPTATEDSRFLEFLPTLTPDVESYRLGDERLYLSPAVGNCLHRHHVANCFGFHLFIQGEFYQDTDLRALESVVSDKGLDEKKLHEFIESLNGVFSGFVVQPASRETWGFNDRFGMGHAYITQYSDELVISSNIWPALLNRRDGDAWEKSALHEILLFGYPLRDRTPLQNTRIVQPGLVLHASPDAITHAPYHSYERQNVLVPRDYVGEFRSVCRSHFESIKELGGDERVGATLSGGHDSRVVINAMMSLGIKPRCYVGYDNFPTWDSRRGARVAKAAGLPHTVLDYQIMDEQDWADANVLADGSGTGSWSMNMAKCSSATDDLLYFGTSGDPVSGGWKIYPHDFDGIESMAKAMMKAYYFEYSTPQTEFMKIFDEASGKDLMPKFVDSFRGGQDLVAAFLINFYREGNFRRVRMFMQGAYLFSSPIHFFHDRRVYEFYSRLPYDELIGQRVHNKLCYFAKARLGAIPATNFPVPVALEPWLLPVAKMLLSSKLRTRFRPVTRKAMASRVEMDPAVADCLAEFSEEIGLDYSVLQAVMATDDRSGILALRARYVANMLNPRPMLASSNLIGPKQIRMIEM